MLKKRLQLFLIYSFSLCAIISIFSAVIYVRVKMSEENIVYHNLKRQIDSLALDISADSVHLFDFQQIGIERSLLYAIWDEQTGRKIDTNFFVLSWDAPNRTQYDKLEKVWGTDKITHTRKLIYSVSTKVILSGRVVVLQIFVINDQIDTEVSDLKNVLISGSIIVSCLGIMLGLVLSYIGMKPIIASWRQQRTFVADASHELRTPLSIIMLKSEHLITNSHDSVDEHLEEIVVIQQECRRMYKMVDDLLFLAKSDSGVLELEMTDFSVGQLTDELQQLYDEFFELEDKRFWIDTAYKGKVTGDYEKIKQVCMIIIDNALRFTEAQDYIKFSTKLRANRVYFDITNNGTPIKNEDLPYIFHRFYKSDTSRNKKHSNDGHGLGLNIAQEIVHAHQSKIRAYVKDDKITGFYFYLNKGKEKQESKLD